MTYRRSRVPLAAVLVLADLAGGAAAAGAAAPRDPYAYFFDETFGDFREELELAREQGKQGLLLFFETDDCPFCQRMKQTVLNRPDVQQWFKERFLSFAVDAEGDTQVTTFAGQSMPSKEFAEKVNRVRATPVIAFYDLRGEQVVRYTGATSSVEEFMWLGEFVAEGHYQNTNFTRFKRDKRAAGQSSQVR